MTQKTEQSHIGHLVDDKIAIKLLADAGAQFSAALDAGKQITVIGPIRRSGNHLSDYFNFSPAKKGTSMLGSLDTDTFNPFL